MRIGSWNVEGLSEAKQAAALTTAAESELDAMVLVETWLRPACGLAQPSHPLWQRLDRICFRLHPNAPRGKSGLSLLVKHSAGACLFSYCPDSRWAIWTTNGATIVAVYIEPSVVLDDYVRTLADITASICEVRAQHQRPILVIGDFNARMGNIIGDRVSNRRRDATLSFCVQTQLDLLNESIKGNPNRWTWKDARGGRSIVDLALTHGAACAVFSIRRPPLPTCHQLLMAEVAVSSEEVAQDPSRWNWARKAFSTPDKVKMCGQLLRPTVDTLAKMWAFIGEQLDLDADAFDPHSAAVILSAQRLVDEGYSIMCRGIRCSLLGLGCWTPATARRGLQSQNHINWKDLAETGNGFFLSSVKNILQGVRIPNGDNHEAPATPTVEEFAAFYQDLFARSAETPSEALNRCRRRIRDVPATENSFFSVSACAKLLKKANPKKAIGPDNLPADVFKCYIGGSAVLLHKMFSVMWAHQIMPTMWKKAFVVPIEKRGADRSDPAQWRGIALQSHLKKLFEVCVRKMCQKRGWTGVHYLQTGFQRKTGAIEAVYALDELTQKYELSGQPLSAALLDVRKAYDRTPRAFIYAKLRRRGMPEHAIGVIKALLESSQVVVRLGSDLSDPADVQVGVPQGDVLSPDLFNVFVDDLAERMIGVCAGYGGCPKFGNTDIPMIMYADDQTLIHWRADALQAMLHEAEAYAAEHQFAYNVNKCAVSHPAANSTWPPMLLYGEPIPVAETTSFLGVKLRNGVVDHSLQLTDRLAQAKRALNGLDMLGAFRTPHLSVAKKRLLISAYGRSRIEYGMAVAPHTKAALKNVDTVMMDVTAKSIGGGRGNALSMRFCGIVPATSRMAKLRLCFLAGLRAQARSVRQVPTLAARVFMTADAQLGSRRRPRGGSQPAVTRTVLQRLVRNLPVYDMSAALAQKYTADFRANFARLPSPDEVAGIEDRALSVALRKHAWADKSALKLIHLQQQDYDRPHPTAYVAGSFSQLLGRWLSNLIPGTNLLCKKCENYRVSRFHLPRCVDTVRLLGEYYCPIAHATHLPATDTILDALIMDLVPKDDRLRAILQFLDRCPYRPRVNPAPTAAAAVSRRPSPLRVAPWRDEEWVKTAIGIAKVVAEARLQCCPTTHSRPTTSSSRDRRQGEDHRDHSHAFCPPTGVFNAENPGASPPILPPDR
jgi:hypothetical protein